MAQLKAPPKFVDHLKDVLVQELKTVGIDAKVEVESVPTTRLYRVMVQAPKFKALKHSERQDLVWRIAGGVLSQEEQLRISMIITLTPGEAAGE